MTSRIQPTLVIMAAGMGSRYGGLKQIDPVDAAGHIIMDFSIYDAILAGFDKVIFVIKKENEADFREVIGNRVSRKLQVSYVFQELGNLPEGYQVPEGRQKPWGTGHAVLSCLDTLDGPFAVINADDYYGREAFSLAAGFLNGQTCRQEDQLHFMMVGYRLGNTLTENGSVARGICKVDEYSMLAGINERTKIRQEGEKAVFLDDNNQEGSLSLDETVSMNMWGFTREFLIELKKRFPIFLDQNLSVNPLKCEYFLPFVVDELIREGRADVKVLTTSDRWFGVTYKEDKPYVMEQIRRMEETGYYPEVF